MLDTLEHQLFDCVSQGENESPYGDMNFYEVTLRVPVGDFSIGTKFKQAILFTSLSALLLTDDNDVDHIFQLHLTIGKKIDGKDLSLIL
ncbi:MAG TPA: hypothetical protein VII94_05530 [Candidatus Saccharimonadales bacterium]